MLFNIYLSTIINRNVKPCSLFVNHNPDIFNITDTLDNLPINLLFSLWNNFI